MISPEEYVILLRGQLVKQMSYHNGQLQATLTSNFKDAQWYPSMNCINRPLIADHASLIPVHDIRQYKNREGTVSILYGGDAVAGFIVNDRR